MGIMDRIHESAPRGRRARVLSSHIAALLPESVTVLDVGSGDGEIASQIMAKSSDVSIHGIDLLVRPQTAIPVEQFDGSRYPFEDDRFDVVTLIDVLHHTNDPLSLLCEAARVARRAVIIKDHLLHGALASPTLRFMDTVGNERHGVALPFNYLTKNEWENAFVDAKLNPITWIDQLGIYPWPANLVFDRRLHFIAVLEHG